jgi:SpoVK/Ycf46/Vps4 family AAA+-type ATPase
MLDEIDKAFAGVGSGSSGDSGTSQRVFGTLLTWMQEKTAPVFIVATANNVEALPAELIRKGRLDELFFVGLPTEEERREIFRVHLSKVRPDSTFDIDRLAHESVNLSGAEIEQCVIEAMHQGFSRGEEFTQSDLIRAINECVPLARIAQAQIERLKAWAIQSGAKSAGIEAIALDNTTNLSPLEID